MNCTYHRHLTPNIAFSPLHPFVSDTVLRCYEMTENSRCTEKQKNKINEQRNSYKIIVRYEVPEMYNGQPVLSWGLAEAAELQPRWAVTDPRQRLAVQRAGHTLVAGALQGWKLVQVS